MVIYPDKVPEQIQNLETCRADPMGYVFVLCLFVCFNHHAIYLAYFRQKIFREFFQR